MGHYAEVIRAIIDTTPDGLRMNPKWEQMAWHDQAVDVFVGRTALTGADFVEFGDTLLQSAPYADIQELVRSGVTKEQSLRELADAREILVVGRNVMNLANQTDLIQDPNSSPLTTLITDIGKLVDNNGRGSRLRRKIVRDEFEPAKHAVTYIHDDFQEPVDRDLLAERARAALHTDKLVDSGKGWLEWVQDEQEYLETRRTFRGVIDLGIASMALEPSAEKLEYVHQGLALNQHYRAQHSTMEELQSYV